MAKKKATPKKRSPARKKAAARERSPAKKKTATRKKTRRPATPDPAKLAKTYPTELEELILFLVLGRSEASAIEQAVKELGVRRTDAAALVGLAGDRIAIAADFDRRREVGQAVRRINHLYTTAADQDDVKSALASQKELNRLLDLYPNDAVGETDEITAERADLLKTIETIAAHLLPLELAPADYPIEEHARIAAEKINVETT